MISVKVKQQRWPLEDEVEITIDLEGAQYIADVMTDEWLRTVDAGVNRGRGDRGARDIANAIEHAIALVERDDDG